jgi:WD40 repeat protein
VASTSDQIKIYGVDNFTKKFDYTVTSCKDGLQIKLIRIVPHTDRLLAVLSNDTICILTVALKLIRHFKPLNAWQKFVQKSNYKIEKLSHYNDDACGSHHVNVNEDDVEMMIKSITRDYQNGTIVDVTFNQNGNSFLVSLLDNTILLCSTSLWDIRRVIKFPDFYIKQTKFVPHLMAHNPSFMMSLTSNGDLLLTRLDDLNSEMLLGMNNSLKFALSPNGKILINIQRDGEIFMFTLDQHLIEWRKSLQDTKKTNIQKTAMTEGQMKSNKNNSEAAPCLSKIQWKVKVLEFNKTIFMLN